MELSSSLNAMIWFRKGLRIHDNPALELAQKGSKYLFPVFVIDPYYMDPDSLASSPGSTRAGINRIQFLLESLVDLDCGLRRLESRLLVLKGEPSQVIARLLKDKWVAEFEKPKGDPSEFIKPATTVLSPYLKFGCLSSRYFFQCVDEAYKTVKKHTQPPVSLAGQLLWRDFFYTVAFGTPNFDRMHGNKICKQIPWRDDEKLFVAWRDAQTGYPWIDAIMIQFIHWEKGRDVFERLLIDSDWAINNGNWQWLSCSSFFYQYHRIYSPISFGKKYDPTGNFIRHFLPVLKDMPKEYIYEPWTAPLSIQSQANCIIGKDYPKPVVPHDLASKECKRQIGAAYALNLSGAAPDAQEKLNSLRRKLEEDDHDALHNTKQKKRMSK